MPRSILVLGVFLGFSVFTHPARGMKGVVVEKLTQSSEAAVSGIKPGDELRFWSRGSSAGAVESHSRSCKSKSSKRRVGRFRFEECA